MDTIIILDSDTDLALMNIHNKYGDIQDMAEKEDWESCPVQIHKRTRADIVDTAIYQLLTDLSGELCWNMNHISKVREALKEVIVNDKRVMTSENFYTEENNE